MIFTYYTNDFFNPLRIQHTAGGTAGRLVVWQGDRVKKKQFHVIYPRKAEILVISTM